MKGINMNLFNDTDLFTNSPPNKKIFDLPDTDLMLYEGFFTKDESDYYYDALLNHKME